MQIDFPEFVGLEDACDDAASTTLPSSLAANALQTAALGEALVLANHQQIDLRTHGDRRLVLLKGAVASMTLSQSERGYGVLHVQDDSKRTADLSVDFAEGLGAELERAGLPRSPKNLLQGALVELVSNIQQHAGSHPKGYALFEVVNESVVLSVFDAGRGVVDGYASVSPELARLSAADALLMAVRDHRSRLAPVEEGRGTGFGTVARAMKSLDARLRVRSGNASLETASGAGAEWVLREQAELRGFVVSLVLSWGRNRTE